MERMGVDVHVVSCEPQIYCYTQYDAASVLPVHRLCNDEVHQMGLDHPDRFSGLAMLPMQDIPRRPSAELEPLRSTTLGLKGAMIGDHGQRRPSTTTRSSRPSGPPPSSSAP